MLEHKHLQTDDQWKQFCEELTKFLQERGIEVSPCRVPFTYHHDWVRSAGILKSQEDPDAQPSILSRADVAQAMQGFRQQYGDRMYWVTTVYGALMYLWHWNTDKFTHLFIREAAFRQIVEDWLDEMKAANVDSEQRWY